MLSSYQFMEQRLLRSYKQELDHSGVKGKRIASRLLDIAEIGLTEQKGAHRIGYSKEEKQAKELVRSWMDEAGLQTREDAAGNVIGRKAGEKDELPVIMSGSHIDSVPNGGHFDGVLGILAALEVVEAWKETNYEPIRPYEIVIFCDEEGSRFNAGLTGSKAIMGDLDLTILNTLKDQEGLSFAEVINKNNLSVHAFTEARRDPKELAAFVEVHIEQGRQLENKNESVGIVTGIAGQCGLHISFKGMAEHAGNTPMNDRKDALVAASEFILNVSEIPKKVSSSAVATVGSLNVYPNGSNVVPGEVRLSVDIRDIHRDTLDVLVNLIILEAKNISSFHKVEIEWEETLRVTPVPISKQMQKLQTEILKANNISPAFIPSGAGHDAMIIGRHVPIAMFFVRSKAGISHNPKEWTSLEDCVIGTHVLKEFLEKLDSQIAHN